MAEERTEEATPKKLADARKRGEVWRSRDLGNAAVVLATAGALVATGPALGKALLDVTSLSLEAVAGRVAGSPTELLALASSVALAASGPLLAAAAIGGGLAAFLQVGPLLAFEPIQPKLERLDPIAALKNLFSQKRLIELLRATVTMVAVGWVAWGVLEQATRALGLLPGRPPLAVLSACADVATALLLRAGAVMAAIAVLDVFYQRWRFLQDQKMTKEEVKREHKEAEGDPHAKAERQRLHRELVEYAMIEQVRLADVLVVNPTHLAVALRYDEEAGHEAPEVVAKGQDGLARRMSEAAREAGVPVMQDVPLARALFELEVGDQIPESLYEAVAIVLRAAWAEREAAGEDRP
ncbi:MAG: EscU/YscU/HrcU family type III secretion system export apparatus switch protein [Myxococcota bacterium]|nr:EscU/YscU/HrcU family type III secretion system export apparatus switch protein [Myxococcota bacterium]